MESDQGYDKEKAVCAQHLTGIGLVANNFVEQINENYFHFFNKPLVTIREGTALLLWPLLPSQLVKHRQWYRRQS